MPEALGIDQQLLAGMHIGRRSAWINISSGPRHSADSGVFKDSFINRGSLAVHFYVADGMEEQKN
jgi:hypothetical protein